MSRVRIVSRKITETVRGNITEISAKNIEDKGLCVNNITKGNIIYINDKTENTIDNYVIDGYWTDKKNQKIEKALLGEVVRFHIITKEVPDDTTMLIQVREWNRLNNMNLGSTKSITIKRNKGYFEFKLNKERWRDLLDNKGEGNELELFCKIYCWGSSIDKGKFLKIENIDDVIIFLVGGAADKEFFGVMPPTNLVKPFVGDIYHQLDELQTKITIYYLDFSDAYQNQKYRFQKKIIDRIKENNKENIYIIGHSLGGWNSAHLSQILTDLGYGVRMLITLDPVGEGNLVYAVSSIYNKKPTPKSDFWINVSIDSDPKKEKDTSDKIANFGERWIPEKGPSINNIMNVSHANVNALFKNKLTTGKSAMNYLIENIKTIIK